MTIELTNEEFIGFLDLAFAPKNHPYESLFARFGRPRMEGTMGIIMENERRDGADVKSRIILKPWQGKTGLCIDQKIYVNEIYSLEDGREFDEFLKKDIPSYLGEGFSFIELSLSGFRGANLSMGEGVGGIVRPNNDLIPNLKEIQDYTEKINLKLKRK